MPNLIEIVQSGYAAFGRGDIPAFLDLLHDDVVWEYGVVAHEIPWLQHRKGKAGAGEFFELVNRELEFKSFAVNSILVGDGVAIALADLECVVRRNGATIIERDEPHVWRFDAAGNVVKFRHAADTAQQARAWAGR